MTEPERFSEERPDSVEAALLRSMRDDAPAAESRAAVLTALGLESAGAGLSSAAASAGGAATAGVSASGGFGTLKWLGGVGVGVAALALGYATWTWRSDVPSLSASGAASVPLPREPVLAPVVTQASARAIPAEPRAETRSEMTPDSTREPAEPVLQRSAARAPERAVPAKPPSRNLSDEVVALERARQALAAGNSSASLGMLEQYDDDFSERRLGPEAEALRIEALLAQGRRPAAEVLAKRFLAVHPKSPLAQRVRSLLAVQPSQP
jgi:hypothetical protein